MRGFFNKSLKIMYKNILIICAKSRANSRGNRQVYDVDNFIGYLTTRV